MPEYVKHNNNGLLSKPRNVQDLARNIKKILINKGLQKKLNENGFNENDKNWTIEKTVKQLVNLYTKYAK